MATTTIHPADQQDQQPSGHYLRQYRYNADYGLQATPPTKSVPSLPWGDKAHKGPAQNQKCNKDNNTKGGSNKSWWAIWGEIRRFKVRGPALQLYVAHLLTSEQKETTASPGRPPERKIRHFKVREPPQCLSPYICHDQGCPHWTRNYPKFLWRISKLSKPEYTDYCNNLHALHQEYLRGKIELDDLQDGEQVLMASITKRFFTPATHNNRSRKPLKFDLPSTHHTEAGPALRALLTQVLVQNRGIQ